MSVDLNSEAVQAFLAQCEELENSKLIMSHNKIRMLLRCLAYYDELRNLVDECKYNFDFDREYSKAIVSLGTSNMFRLPLSNRKKVALVVCLLLDFDVPRRDFIRFVMEFYPSPDRSESYRGFCNGIIVPFKKAVLELLTTATHEDNVREENSTQDLKVQQVSIALKEQAGYLIDNAIAEVKASNLPEQERYDAQFMLDVFSTVLEMRDAQLIKAYWMALRNTLKYNKLCGKIIAATDELLKAYLVL
ncbi:MAG TPA: hypothetical protein IAC70_01515 [Candidatus Faecicola pullistercoris]|nr:hypothetical protein [Candidatus Faecicola pullistercoris]